MELFKNIINGKYDMILFIIIFILLFKLYCRQQAIENMSDTIDIGDTIDIQIKKTVDDIYNADVTSMQNLAFISEHINNINELNIPCDLNINDKLEIDIDNKILLGNDDINYIVNNDNNNNDEKKIYIKNIEPNVNNSNNYGLQIGIESNDNQLNDNDILLKLDNGWSIETTDTKLIFKNNDEDQYIINNDDQDITDNDGIEKTILIKTLDNYNTLLSTDAESIEKKYEDNNIKNNGTDVSTIPTITNNMNIWRTDLYNGFDDFYNQSKSFVSHGFKKK